MRRAGWIGLGWVAIAALACGDDGTTTSGAEGSGSETTATAATTNETSTATTATTASTMSGSGDTTSGPPGTTTSAGSTDTGATDTGSGSATDTGTGSSTGAGSDTGAGPCCDPTMEPICFEGASCCDDGTWQCNDGIGQPACPGPLGEVCMGAGSDSGGMMCQMQGATCAQGQPCCGGLQCCAGQPIPPGAEYCGFPCPISDRHKKENFDLVDPQTVLDALVQIPISTWNYTFESEGVRHIGPMAQDFMAAFSVGGTDKAIFQIDADGVALASIQALHTQLQEAQADKKALQTRVDDLEKRLAALEAGR